MSRKNHFENRGQRHFQSKNRTKTFQKRVRKNPRFPRMFTEFETSQKSEDWSRTFRNLKRGLRDGRLPEDETRVQWEEIVESESEPEVVFEPEP